MIALEQNRQYLEGLGLKRAVEVLDSALDAAASKQLTDPEILEQLLSAAVDARRERYLSTRTKMAHSPSRGHWTNSTSPSSPPSTTSRAWPRENGA